MVKFSFILPKDHRPILLLTTNKTYARTAYNICLGLFKNTYPTPDALHAPGLIMLVVFISGGNWASLIQIVL